MQQQLLDWSLHDVEPHRKLVFFDFNEAFGFMSPVALIAEPMGLYLEWSNVWNQVVIDLTTQDTNTLATYNLESAIKISRIL